jgi:hypothetical protein
LKKNNVKLRAKHALACAEVNKLKETAAASSTNSFSDAIQAYKSIHELHTAQAPAPGTDMKMVLEMVKAFQEATATKQEAPQQESPAATLKSLIEIMKPLVPDVPNLVNAILAGKPDHGYALRQGTKYGQKRREREEEDDEELKERKPKRLKNENPKPKEEKPKAIEPRWQKKKMARWKIADLTSFLVHKEFSKEFIANICGRNIDGETLMDLLETTDKSTEVFTKEEQNNCQFRKLKRVVDHWNKKKS